MRSLILRTSSNYLFYMLLIFSVFLLLKGHNSSGGGFVGGLMAASAFLLYAIAYSIPQARSRLKLHPQTYIGWGLLLVLGDGILGMVSADAFLTALWLSEGQVFGSEIALGTPLVFDLGVYLVVLGVTITTIFTLLEE